MSKYAHRTGSERLHGRLLSLNYGVNASTLCSLYYNVVTVMSQINDILMGSISRLILISQ